MTVRGIELSSRILWLFAALAGFVALAAVFLQAGSAVSLGSTAPTGSISCDATELTYGQPIGCEVDAPDGAEIHWGDGAVTSAGAATHTIAAVGTVDVQLAAGSIVVATHTVEITPDVAIDCEYGLPKTVYELTPALDGAALPYEYVYLAADGSKVYPGDDAYPTTLRAAMDQTPSLLGAEPIVGICRTVSAAIDDLGGTTIWTVEDGWHPAREFRSRNITPGTQGDWEGVQPIDVTLTIDVDGHEASERVGVYFGGCG